MPKAQKEIIEYLKTQRVGVLAVEMMDGSPHAATVHFANSEEPLVFYFETNRDYRKAEALFGRDVTRSSFVVGIDENNLRTLQLDGAVQLLKPEEEKGVFVSVYLAKFPKKAEKVNNPKSVFFKFTPTWWRYTDWASPEKKILTSD